MPYFKKKRRFLQKEQNYTLNHFLKFRFFIKLMENPSEISDFRGVLVRVVRLERTVSWSQTYREYFFRSFIAVFGTF